MSRKKLNEGIALEHLLWTRVTLKNYQRLVAMLEKSRYQSMSELLRNMICEGQVHIFTHDDGIDLIMEELIGIRKELKAIGVNINQLTRQFHADPSPENRLQMTKLIGRRFEDAETLMGRLYEIIANLAKKWLQG